MKYSIDKTLPQYERVLTTLRCRDTESIPKVPGSGELFSENGRSFQRMHNGLKIPEGIYHEAWMVEIIRHLRGHHEPQEEKVFWRVLQEIPPGACMMELGAYWGYYSMWFQKSVPGAVCHLIEPNADKLVSGKQCFAANGMTGSFTRAFIGSVSDPNAIFEDWDGKKYPVAKVCLDDYLAEHRISFIHLVHSDIQGDELDMLLGARRALEENRIGYFFISTHSGKIHESCLAFLKERRFHVVSAYTPTESYSEDGLIVARAPTLPGVRKVKISKRSPSIWASLRSAAKGLFRRTPQR